MRDLSLLCLDRDESIFYGLRLLSYVLARCLIISLACLRYSLPSYVWLFLFYVVCDPDNLSFSVGYVRPAGDLGLNLSLITDVY